MTMHEQQSQAPTDIFKLLAQARPDQLSRLIRDIEKSTKPQETRQ